MPKTKLESIFFTGITAWMMVYVMTLYNTVLSMGSFTNHTFLITYCRNFVMALPVQLFLVGPLARLIFRCVFLNAKKSQKRNDTQYVNKNVA